MKKTLSFVFAFFFVFSLALAGCGKSTPEVTGESLEINRQISKDNAVFVAKQYRAENPRLKDMDLVGHPDTAISPSCPQGDGWATISAMAVDQATKAVTKFELICSTYSPAMGCYLKGDFKQKQTLANSDGHCADPKVVVLKKIAG